MKASLPIMIEIRWMVFLFGSPVGNLDQMGDTSSQLVCKFLEEYFGSEVCQFVFGAKWFLKGLPS